MASGLNSIPTTSSREAGAKRVRTADPPSVPDQVSSTISAPIEIENVFPSAAMELVGYERLATYFPHLDIK